jgi:hypothetical protein
LSLDDVSAWDGAYDRTLMKVLIDPAGRWAVRGSARCAELWIIERVAFDHRPAWQSARDGPVACLHHALSLLEPHDADALTCVWTCDDPASRPDVENRLFTNVTPKATQAPHGPSPFAHLPGHILLERSFRQAPPLSGFDASQCLYYRYALSPPGRAASEWQAPGPATLACWSQVPVTGLSTGNGWATWASMRAPGTSVTAGDDAAPHTGEFTLRLLVRSPVPFALVSRMEWIVDGVIASLQREPDPSRAQVISGLIKPHLAARGLTHDLVAAQCQAPPCFAPPPFLLYKNQGGCRLNPADDLLVRADIELAVVPDLKSADLSGVIHKATPVDQ